MSSTTSEIDLLGFVAEGLPRLIDGESLYSWCSRYAYLSGVNDSGLIGKILFGDKQARFRHDLPVGLQHFHSVTGGVHGKVEDLLALRTLLGFHQPFLSREMVSRAQAGMLAGTNAAARLALSLSKTGWRVPAPLKACPMCMAEDELSVQVSYWYQEHQWPSMRVCLRHNVPLLILGDEAHYAPMRGWWLPAAVPAAMWRTPPALEDTDFARLLSLAEWTLGVVGDCCDVLTDRELRYCYLLRAKERGWLAFDGSLRFKELRSAFWEEYRGLSAQPGLEVLRDAQLEHGGFLGLIFHKFGGCRHPFKHLLVMRFLYEGIADFREHFRFVQRQLALEGENGVDHQLKAGQSRLCRQLADEQISVSAAAAQAGISVGTAIRYIKKAGVAYRRRPRRLTAAIERQLKIAFEAGASMAAIAKELSLSEKYIRAYLADKPDLREHYRKLLQEINRQQRRKHFLEVLNSNVGVPIKRIRRITGNGFEWLLRNDLDWLRDQLPGVWHR